MPKTFLYLTLSLTDGYDYEHMKAPEQCGGKNEKVLREAASVPRIDEANAHGIFRMRVEQPPGSFLCHRVIRNDLFLQKLRALGVSCLSSDKRTTDSVVREREGSALWAASKPWPCVGTAALRSRCCPRAWLEHGSAG